MNWNQQIFHWKSEDSYIWENKMIRSSATATRKRIWQSWRRVPTNRRVCRSCLLENREITVSCFHSLEGVVTITYLKSTVRRFMFVCRLIRVADVLVGVFGFRSSRNEVLIRPRENHESPTVLNYYQLALSSLLIILRRTSRYSDDCFLFTPPSPLPSSFSRISLEPLRVTA